MLGLGIGDLISGIKLAQKYKPPTTRERLLATGSDTFRYSVPAIAAASKLTVDVGKEFPRAKYYFPLDSLEIINNSNVSIMFWFTPTLGYEIPSFMVKPLSRRPFTGFIIENLSAGTAIAVNEITIHMRRLAPDITPVASVGGG